MKTEDRLLATLAKYPRNGSIMKKNEVNVKSTPRPLAEVKINSRHRDVQVVRRNARSGQPERAPRTLLSRKESMTAIGQAPQAGNRTDTTQSQRGGPARSASSLSRRYRHKPVYDPLLGRHPIPAVKVPNLLELVVDDENIISAVKKVNSEPDKAVGCDRKTVREVCLPLLESTEKRDQLRELIITGKYRPDPIRTTQIPKANGKTRTLGIATVMDRVVQTMILQTVMDYMPGNPWSEYSFAYQSGLGVADAIAEVNRIRSDGYTFGVSLDLKAFFDNVPHDRLIAKLRKHIADGRVVRLVTAFITPVVLGEHRHRTVNRIGTPQGSVLSPWLASMLYLDELDKEITHRGHRFVRYADDVTVFCHSKHAAKRVRNELIEFLENTMRCPVNREKTKITAIERISLLGVYLSKGKWHIDREKLLQLRSNFRSLLEEYAKTREELHLSEAIQRIGGFLAHYVRIPGIAVKEVNELKRWCLRTWNASCSNCEKSYRRWFLKVVNP